VSKLHWIFMVRNWGYMAASKLPEPSLALGIRFATILQLERWKHNPESETEVSGSVWLCPQLNIPLHETHWTTFSTCRPLAHYNKKPNYIFTQIHKVLFLSHLLTANSCCEMIFTQKFTVIVILMPPNQTGTVSEIERKIFHSQARLSQAQNANFQPDALHKHTKITAPRNPNSDGGFHV